MKVYRHMFVVLILALGLSACASAVPTPTPTPRDGEPETPVITWHREGGIAGFCDDLFILADGNVIARSCNRQGDRYGTLSAEQLAQLTEWVAQYASFDAGYRDPAVADAMQVRFSFAGGGEAEADAAAQEAMMQFAGEIFGSLAGEP